MRVCICDDIVEYRLAIKSYVEQYFKSENIKLSLTCFDSGNQLLSCNSISDFDIFFIDIELGDSNGIEIIKKLNSICKNSFYIIVTAYKNYLDAAMDLNVLRFIEKPIKQERVYSALKRAIEVINNSVIEVKGKNGAWHYVNKNKIVYAEARNKKTHIITVDDVIESPIPFRDFKRLLEEPLFLVPHNSFIISKKYIVTFKKNTVTLLNGEKEYIVPISANRQSEFRRQLHLR